MKDLLRRLTSIPAPSGREEQIRAFIQAELKDYCDELTVDTMGNLIAFKRGGKTKLQFAAHMDEIGVIVTAIDEQGFLRFSNIGGIRPHRLIRAAGPVPKRNNGCDRCRKDRRFKDS